VTSVKPPAPALSSQLPLWGDKVRGLPNPIARSSLFTVGNQNEPRVFHRTHKAIQTIAGYTITYKGEELRQDDEDCFLQLVHLARHHAAGDKVEFTAYSFLKELGWKKSSEGYERLRTTLDRLQLTGLRISTAAGESEGGDGAGGGYQGALVRKFAWKDETGRSLTRWVVFLEPEIVTLFAPNGYTQVFWEQRMRLRSSLAKYLHSYYASHESPYPIKSATLKSLSGSRASRLSDFRKSLRTALQQLVDEAFLDTWRIDANDLVHVVRSPKSKQQQLRIAQAERAAA
jgi:hypothetical protein